MNAGNLIDYVFENGTFEKLKDAVEMDEACIGGKDSNEHAHKRTKALTGSHGYGLLRWIS